MLNKQAIEKKYFQTIMPGHYIDVQTSESQWKIAKVIDKDKRYIYVTYDGWLNKQDQFFISSCRVAPLRAFTEGFTGSALKINRNNMPKIQDLKNYIQVAQEKFFNEEKAKSFQITQMLRGQLFVYVHDLVCKQYSLNQSEVKETNIFLYTFLDLVLKVLSKAIQDRNEYFSAPLATNKFLYLISSKIALIQSIQQLLILVQIIIKTQTYKFATLFKNNKAIISQDKFAEYFLQKKGLVKLYQIFVSNDKNGRWYPSSIRKSIYKIMLKYSVLKLQFSMPKLPKYLVKDFQEFYSIYPCMVKYSPEIELEDQFIDFSVNILLNNSPFDAKLKSIQELRKILEGKNQFQFLDKETILNKIDQMQVLQKLLDNKNFNPEVFKRFVPILNTLCKVKSLNLKHIHCLFEIIKFRHESETGIIFQIIAQISQFAPSSLLDNVYAQICKIDMNSQQTMNFIKTFTIKAIQNLSKEKSYFSGWFGKKKGSSKHGYYGLNILYKQSHDQGKITKQKMLFALNIIKQILAEGAFAQQKWNYIVSCLQFIKKRKSFGQSIKLICLLLSTYEENSFFADDRKKVVDKLEAKYSVVDLIVEGFKNIQSIIQVKVTHEESFQYFYDLIELFSPYIKVPLKVKHIEYLWYKCDANPLLNFLKKSKPNEKLKKFLAPEIIEEIFTVIFKKPSFYKRNLTYKQFETIYELFISYHLDKDNISMNSKDSLIRYNKHNLLGLEYFINFLEHSKDEQNFEKAAKRTIQLILRPNPVKAISIQVLIEQKVLVWKQFFKKSIQRLVTNPKKCLHFIQYFYSSIQGRLYKQISSLDTSNLQILVEFDEQKKTVSIEKFSTIFRLRKLIKQKFKISHDFNMFNVKLNKNVTFEEQEDFSVNAMPLVDNGRGVTIKIEMKQNKFHSQEMSILFFKQDIQKQQKLYQLIFKIIEEKNLSTEIEKIFWKTIELLPLNKLMMTDIEKCDNYTLQKWEKYLQSISQSSLQYKLNIILNLIKSSQKWALKMQKTGGLLGVINFLLRYFKIWEYSFQNQTLCFKIMQVIEKCYQKCPKKELSSQILKEINTSIVRALQKQFQSLSPTDMMEQTQEALSSKKVASLMLINKTLQIYLSNLKMLLNMNQTEIVYMKLNTFTQILDYALFLKKTESTQKFAEQVSISLNFAVYHKPQDRASILNYLISSLNLQKLMSKERTQNYFKFLITVLYSFQQPKKQQIQEDLTVQNIHLVNQYKQIWQFVNQVIENKFLKDDQKSLEQITYGSFSLLKFVLTKANQGMQVDLRLIFQKLIDYFVFPTCQQYCKRVKTQKNKKILFQIIKKISFQDAEVVTILMNKLCPFLQKNKYRKNTIISWNLHFQNSDKKLFVGLQNLGATCYINCLFQQLFMINNFRQSFISIDSREYKQQLQKNQIYQLQKLFYSLKYNNRKSQSTKKFCSSFITYQGESINPVVQSDADEFFNALMQKIQTFLKNTGKHDILQKTFEGKLSNQLNCQGCPHRSQKIQSFMSIGVNLKNKKTLEEALKGYVQGQILDGDNAYYCQICQKKVRTLKRLCIKQLPNILVIILKRFEYNFDTYKKIKINSYLQFPEELNMTEFTSEYIQSKSMDKIQGMKGEQNQKIINKGQTANNKFHLRGSVIHAGNADAGHYYSFIKQKQKWYEFNDQYINQISYSKVQEEGFGGDEKQVDEFKMEKYKNAYILFYERQSTKSQMVEEKSTQIQQSLNQEVISRSNQMISEENQNQKPQNGFYRYMSDNISQQNYETTIFSSLLEPNFIHFWENLSILQNQKIQKFIILYFHTVILRDKSKYEYAPNYFRIMTKYLGKMPINQNSAAIQSNQLAQWFLKQISKPYIKQFLIQAPKTVRLICVSLVLTAIQYSPSIPQQMPLLLVSSLRKNSMSPFCLIIKALSKRKQSLQKLQQLNYSRIALSLLLNERKIQQLDLPQPQYEVQNYFGSDSSQFQTERQKCSSALLESLEYFTDIDEQSLLKLNESYSFRKSNKIILKKIALILYKQIQNDVKGENDIVAMIKMFEEKVLASNHGKELIEKYLLFMRHLVWEGTSCALKNKVHEFVAFSFRHFILTCSRFYEAMDWIMRQITKIASKNEEFKILWRNLISSTPTLKLEVQSWLKEVQKPQYLNMKDDFFQKLRQMDLNDKKQYLKNYSKKMKLIISWMFENVQTQEKLEQSDFQQLEQNQIIQVRNKAFKVRQKFQKSIIYFVSFVDKEDHSLWAYLEKNEIETFNNF